MNQIIISMNGREKRVAVVQNGRAERFHLFQPSHTSLVGFIYYGIVTKVEKGMNACFVNIGHLPNGYLHRDQLPDHGGKPISQLVHQGQKIIVQVIKDKSESKGPRLSAVIEWSGEHVVYLPEGNYIALSKKVADEEKRAKLKTWIDQHKEPGEGLILRTKAFESDEANLLKEWNQLRGEHARLLQETRAVKAPILLREKPLVKEEVFKEMTALKSGELICDQSAFIQELKSDSLYSESNWPVIYDSKEEDLFTSLGLEDEINRALKQVVWLPSGGFLVIERTEAMTVIDVNTGKYTGKSSQSQTVLLTNKEAAVEIARQLRLRDISGMIIVDFIDMFHDKDRRTVENLMKKEVKQDLKSVFIREFTSLGLMQITRKKTKPSLSETLTEPCGVCAGTGRVLSTETVAFRLERQLLERRREEAEAVLVEVTEEVRDVFAGENQQSHHDLEEWLNKKIYYSVVESPFPVGEMIRFGSLKELAAKGQTF